MDLVDSARACTKRANSSYAAWIRGQVLGSGATGR